MDHRYLFVIFHDRIAVFRQVVGRVEPVKKEGEIFFLIMNDFWDWWRRKSEYRSTDKLDFCFVWNERPSVIFEEDFLSCASCEESCWDKATLLNALGQIPLSARLSDEYGQSVSMPNASCELQTDVKLNKCDPLTVQGESDEFDFSCLNLDGRAERGESEVDYSHESEAQKYLRLEREREEKERSRS